MLPGNEGGSRRNNSQSASSASYADGYGPGSSVYQSQVPQAPNQYQFGQYPGSANGAGTGTTPLVGSVEWNRQQWATPAGKSAREMMIQTLRSYGLDSLTDDLDRFIKEGVAPGSDELTLKLRNTDAYKQRFSANEARIKAGLPALSEGEYIQTEAGYRNAMRQMGMPAGFYDNPDDFKRFLENDISVAEVTQRVTMASDLVNSKDPETLKALEQYYGLNKGDIAAFYLDEDKALPLLQRRADAARIGGEAISQGLDVKAGFAEGLVGKGIDRGAARNAFANVADSKSVLGAEAQASGVNLTEGSMINAELAIDAKDAAKVKGLKSQRRAAWAGSNGGTNTLGGMASGSF